MLISIPLSLADWNKITDALRVDGKEGFADSLDDELEMMLDDRDDDIDVLLCQEFDDL